MNPRYSEPGGIAESKHHHTGPEMNWQDLLAKSFAPPAPHLEAVEENGKFCVAVGVRCYLKTPEIYDS